MFGEIIDGTMHYSAAGDMIVTRWLELPQQFPTLELADWVVMPNHHHGIVILKEDNTISIPKVVQWFKTVTTNDYIRGVKTHSWTPFAGYLWQRSYYDRIIRDDDAFQRACGYIKNNPQNWQEDDQYGG